MVLKHETPGKQNLRRRIIRYLMLYLVSLVFVEVGFACLLFAFFRYLLEDMSTVDKNYPGTGLALFFYAAIGGLLGLVVAIPVVLLANKVYLWLGSELRTVQPKERIDG